MYSKHVILYSTNITSQHAYRFSTVKMDFNWLIRPCNDLSLEECPCSMYCQYVQLRQTWNQKFKKSITITSLVDETTRRKEQTKLKEEMNKLEKEIELLERALVIPSFLLFEGW